MKKNSARMTFWEHLDELRHHLLVAVIALAVCTVGSLFMADRYTEERTPDTRQFQAPYLHIPANWASAHWAEAMGERSQRGILPLATMSLGFPSLVAMFIEYTLH